MELSKLGVYKYDKKF